MWPALAVIAASMFAKHMANKDAQNRANSLRGAMDTYQRGKAQQNEAAINQLVSQQTPDARAKELQAIQASRTGSMQSTVDSARAASPISAVAGTTGQDYAKASIAAADTVANRTKRAISQMATMGAPGEASLSSGIRFGRAAGNVDAGNQAIGNVGAGYMRDINLVRPNPFLSMAGDVGMAVGGGMLGAGGAFAPSGAPNTDPTTFPDSGETTGGKPRTVRSRMSDAFAQWGAR